MKMTGVWLAAVAASALLIHGGGSPASAQTLSGSISSAEEGAMEGVIVSAKKEGSTITVSVVSDAGGHYTFPAGRLEPGKYALTIRAAGYDLQVPKSADIAGDAKADLKLAKTRNLAAQLSNAEW